MRIISQRKQVQDAPEYIHDFDAGNGSGWGFRVNRDGSAVNPDTAENLRLCLETGVDKFGCAVRDDGIREYVNSYWMPAVGECGYCRLPVYLDGFTNTCDCGADYNMSGQLLAPRSQWGEETGESLADILSIA